MIESLRLSRAIPEGGIRLSEFHELIRNFNKCRDYVRDFFVYGFKSRGDFRGKSGRTYDDERRRIESWLSEYVRQDYPSATKNISLQMDSNLLETNPLYRVWKTKSFTTADITLHFYLLDLLSTDAWLSVSELTDRILDKFELEMDPQMVRRKCKEYEQEGLLLSRKSGKTVLYHRGTDMESLLKSLADYTSISSEKDMPLHERFLDAISFFQLSAPFGIIGSTILDQNFAENHIFRIKHSFLVHTLEDEIVLALIEAMKTPACVRLTSTSNQRETVRIEYGLPLRFFVSTRTGRRYLCLYCLTNRSEKGRFKCVRLDQIKKAEHCTDKNTPDRIYALTQKAILRHGALLTKLSDNLDQVWGVSFDNTQNSNRKSKHSLASSARRQTIQLTLHIDEEHEDFILHRLEREGKGGTITRIAPDTFRYEKTVFDAQEAFPWLRTFIGRIVELAILEQDQEDTPPVINHSYTDAFYADLEKMYEMYGITDQE